MDKYISDLLDRRRILQKALAVKRNLLAKALAQEFSSLSYHNTNFKVENWYDRAHRKIKDIVTTAADTPVSVEADLLAMQAILEKDKTLLDLLGNTADA